MKIKHIKKDKASSVEANDHVFATAWKPELVKQVIVAMQSNRRANTAQTKDRSQVRGADTKPWRQKGTGRARHGSIYSPIWRGGGVTFGPLNVRNYDKKVNRKARNAALRSALSKRQADETLVVAELPDFESPKTKTAAEWLLNVLVQVDRSELGDRKKNAVTLVVESTTDVIKKSFRNLPGVHVVSALDINAEDALLPQYLVIAGEASLRSLESRLEKK